MNIDNILQKIRDNSILQCRASSCAAGPTVEVKLYDETGRFIVGLVPIDNESDERFADYLIHEAWKATEGKRPEVKDL